MRIPDILFYGLAYIDDNRANLFRCAWYVAGCIIIPALFNVMNPCATHWCVIELVEPYMIQGDFKIHVQAALVGKLG